MARNNICDITAPWNKMRRVILSDDKRVVGVLDPNNSNNYSDGTAVNWTTIENNGYNVMVEIPKFYVKNDYVNNQYVFGISATEKEGYVLHDAFMRDWNSLCDDITATPTIKDFRYISAFEGWRDSSGRLRSLPNKTITVSRSQVNFRDDVKAMGTGYCMLDYFLMSAVKLLMLLEYETFNIQNELGAGKVSAGVLTTGTTMNQGNYNYGVQTLDSAMSYRGIENFYGNTWTFVDGIIKNTSNYFAYTNKGFNNTQNGYTILNQIVAPATNGFIKTLQQNYVGSWFLPVTTTTNWRDGMDAYYLYAAGFMACTHGGGAGESTYLCSPFRLNFSSAGAGTVTGAITGTRLCL